MNNFVPKEYPLSLGNRKRRQCALKQLKRCNRCLCLCVGKLFDLFPGVCARICEKVKKLQWEFGVKHPKHMFKMV